MTTARTARASQAGRRRTFAAATAIVGMVLLMAWMAGFLSPGKIRPGQVTVAGDLPVRGTAELVRVDDLPIWRDSVGTVSATTSFSISSQVMANVTQVDVGAGSRVHKGERLLRLDPRDLAARLQEAQAAAEAARATLASSTADLKRFSDLLGRAAVTRKEFEDVQTAHALAQARMRASEQAVAQARVALEHTELVSPIDGVVVEKMVNPGDLAVPGRPLLQLQDPGQVRLEATVPEDMAPRLAVGTPVTVIVDALGKSFETHIEELVPRADPQTRTITVRAGLPGGEGLQPGLFCRLRMSEGSVRSLSVPSSAVRQVGQLETVLVKTPQGIRLRHVQTGARRGDHVEILAGLAEGESVMVPADGVHE